MDNDDRKHLSRNLHVANRAFAVFRGPSAITVAVYAFAGIWEERTLPAPLNAVILVGLASLTLGTYVTKHVTGLRLTAMDQAVEQAQVAEAQADEQAQLAETQAALRTDLETLRDDLQASIEAVGVSISHRDGRLYAILARCESAWRDTIVREVHPSTYALRQREREEVTREVPTGKLFPPVRAVASVPAAAVVPIERATGDNRPPRRRRNRGRSQQDPVPADYLEDMSEAVKLGQKIEAERRRRGPEASGSEA